jgi:hypothetical protein
LSSELHVEVVSFKNSLFVTHPTFKVSSTISTSFWESLISLILLLVFQHNWRYLRTKTAMAVVVCRLS